MAKKTTKQSAYDKVKQAAYYSQINKLKNKVGPSYSAAQFETDASKLKASMFPYAKDKKFKNKTILNEVRSREGGIDNEQKLQAGMKSKQVKAENKEYYSPEATKQRVFNETFIDTQELADAYNSIGSGTPAPKQSSKFMNPIDIPFAGAAALGSAAGTASMGRPLDEIAKSAKFGFNNFINTGDNTSVPRTAKEMMQVMELSGDVIGGATIAATDFAGNLVGGSSLKDSFKNGLNTVYDYITEPIVNKMNDPNYVIESKLFPKAIEEWKSGNKGFAVGLIGASLIDPIDFLGGGSAKDAAKLNKLLKESGLVADINEDLVRAMSKKATAPQALFQIRDLAMERADLVGLILELQPDNVKALTLRKKLLELAGEVEERAVKIDPLARDRYLAVQKENTDPLPATRIIDEKNPNPIPPTVKMTGADEYVAKHKELQNTVENVVPNVPEGFSDDLIATRVHGFDMGIPFTTASKEIEKELIAKIKDGVATWDDIIDVYNKDRGAFMAFLGEANAAEIGNAYMAGLDVSQIPATYMDMFLKNTGHGAWMNQDEYLKWGKMSRDEKQAALRASGYYVGAGVDVPKPVDVYKNAPKQSPEIEAEAQRLIAESKARHGIKSDIKMDAGAGKTSKADASKSIDDAVGSTLTQKEKRALRDQAVAEGWSDYKIRTKATEQAAAKGSKQLDARAEKFVAKEKEKEMLDAVKKEVESKQKNEAYNKITERARKGEVSIDELNKIEKKDPDTYEALAREVSSERSDFVRKGGDKASDEYRNMPQFVVDDIRKKAGKSYLTYGDWEKVPSHKMNHAEAMEEANRLRKTETVQEETVDAIKWWDEHGPADVKKLSPDNQGLVTRQAGTLQTPIKTARLLLKKGGDAANSVLDKMLTNAKKMGIVADDAVMNEETIARIEALAPKFMPDEWALKKGKKYTTAADDTPLTLKERIKKLDAEKALESMSDTEKEWQSVNKPLLAKKSELKKAIKEATTEEKKASLELELKTVEMEHTTEKLAYYKKMLDETGEQKYADGIIAIESNVNAKYTQEVVDANIERLEKLKTSNPEKADLYQKRIDQMKNTSSYKKKMEELRAKKDALRKEKLSSTDAVVRKEKQDAINKIVKQERKEKLAHYSRLYDETGSLKFKAAAERLALNEKIDNAMANVSNLRFKIRLGHDIDPEDLKKAEEEYYELMGQKTHDALYGKRSAEIDAELETVKILEKENRDLISDLKKKIDDGVNDATLDEYNDVIQNAKDNIYQLRKHYLEEEYHFYQSEKAHYDLQHFIGRKYAKGKLSGLEIDEALARLGSVDEKDIERMIEVKLETSRLIDELEKASGISFDGGIRHDLHTVRDIHGLDAIRQYLHIVLPDEAYRKAYAPILKNEWLYYYRNKLGVSLAILKDEMVDYTAEEIEETTKLQNKMKVLDNRAKRLANKEVDNWLGGADNFKPHDDEIIKMQHRAMLSQNELIYIRKKIANKLSAKDSKKVNEILSGKMTESVVELMDDGTLKFVGGMEELYGILMKADIKDKSTIWSRIQDKINFYDNVNYFRTEETIEKIAKATGHDSGRIKKYIMKKYGVSAEELTMREFKNEMDKFMRTGLNFHQPDDIIFANITNPTLAAPLSSPKRVLRDAGLKDLIYRPLQEQFVQASKTFDVKVKALLGNKKLQDISIQEIVDFVKNDLGLTTIKRRVYDKAKKQYVYNDVDIDILVGEVMGFKGKKITPDKLVAGANEKFLKKKLIGEMLSHHLNLEMEQAIKSVEATAELLPENGSKYVKEYVASAFKGKSNPMQDIGNDFISQKWEAALNTPFIRDLMTSVMPHLSREMTFNIGTTSADAARYNLTNHVYRAALMHNNPSAIRNLSQQLMTMAQIGPRDYMSGLTKLSKKEWDRVMAESGWGKNLIEESRSQANDIYETAFGKAGWMPFQTTEHLNRVITWLGAEGQFIRLSKGCGLSEDVVKNYARMYADDIVDKTQFSYDLLNKIPIMDAPVMRSIGQFFTYPGKAMEFVYDAGINAAKNAGKEYWDDPLVDFMKLMLYEQKKTTELPVILNDAVEELVKSNSFLFNKKYFKFRKTPQTAVAIGAGIGGLWAGRAAYGKGKEYIFGEEYEPSNDLKDVVKDFYNTMAPWTNYVDYEGEIDIAPPLVKMANNIRKFGFIGDEQSVKDFYRQTVPMMIPGGVGAKKYGDAIINIANQRQIYERDWSAGRVGALQTKFYKETKPWSSVLAGVVLPKAEASKWDILRDVNSGASKFDKAFNTYMRLAAQDKLGTYTAKKLRKQYGFPESVEQLMADEKYQEKATKYATRMMVGSVIMGDNEKAIQSMRTLGVDPDALDEGTVSSEYKKILKSGNKQAKKRFEFIYEQIYGDAWFMEKQEEFGEKVGFEQ